jgi:hypothetical protein
VHTSQQVEPHPFSLNANVSCHKVLSENTGEVELGSCVIRLTATDPLQSFILKSAAGMQILQSPERGRI